MASEPFFKRQAPQRANTSPPDALATNITPEAVSENRQAPVPGTPEARASEPSSAGSSNPEASGSKLMVGPGIRLKGVEITNCDTLVVEGHMEAKMDARRVEIAKEGSFEGAASFDIAEIHGVLSGELTIRKTLKVHSTGKVSGKIHYGSVIIEEGGKIIGDIQSLGDDEKPLRAVPLQTPKDETGIK